MVERQLGLLDEMKRQERDPERLAVLFQLDHMAARLRRNEENVLVLAGGQAHRRAEADEWLPLDELVLAAVSEAALAEAGSYQRVHFDVEDYPRVSGRVASDLIHVLAELFDNATSFSPPESPVRVSWADDGDDIELTITDQGIGLAPGALVEANTLLGMPPDLDLAASERMGLVVVSHLAARHQIRVNLVSSSSGTSAKVRIPGEVMLREENR